MMVEYSPNTKNIDQLIRDLDQATMQLEEINSKPQLVSNREFNDLIKVWQNFNANLNPTIWGEKKFLFAEMLEGMNEKLMKALNAIQVFQRLHPGRDNQRSVEQAINSLVFTLKELNKFDKKLKELRDLKKYKIGDRTEKSNESKET